MITWLIVFVISPCARSWKAECALLIMFCMLCTWTTAGEVIAQCIWDIRKVISHSLIFITCRVSLWVCIRFTNLSILLCSPLEKWVIWDISSLLVCHPNASSCNEKRHCSNYLKASTEWRQSVWYNYIINYWEASVWTNVYSLLYCPFHSASYSLH